VLALGDRAFERRVEGVAAEEGQAGDVVGETGVVGVVVGQGFEAGKAAEGLAATEGFDVVDVVVVDEAEIGWGGGLVVGGVDGLLWLGLISLVLVSPGEMGSI